MPTPPAPVRIDVATLQGSGPSMQDRVFVAENAVILLDGATDPDATELDGGWIANEIGRNLVKTLAVTSRLSLADALADAIHATAQRYGLRPGAAPSTTVTMVRWDNEVVDVLVLGDSPAIVQHVNESVDVIEDTRLNQLPNRDQFGLPRPDPSKAERARDLVAYERSMRNRLGGYWIAEADPSAAHHALLATVPRSDVLAVLLVSDGISDGINHYRKPSTWAEALSIAKSGTRNLIEVVHTTEKTDLTCSRWPRSKIHDDKAAALISLVAQDRDSTCEPPSRPRILRRAT